MTRGRAKQILDEHYLIDDVEDCEYEVLIDAIMQACAEDAKRFDALLDEYGSSGTNARIRAGLEDPPMYRPIKVPSASRL